MPFPLAPAELETPEAEPVPLHEAYRACEEIARAHYENFPVASRFIPADRRIALAAIYAFARQADDIADARAPSEDRLRALDAIEEALLRALDGAPQGAIFTALADAVERHRLPVEPFLDLLSAFRLDARDATFPTWDDLLAYCRGSANPVGRLVLALYKVEDPEALGAPRGTNFSLAFRALPPDQRDAIRAVHAFSREVDDSVDEEPDRDRAREEIVRWRGEVAACYEGEPVEPAARALRPHLQRFRIPRLYLEELLSGVEMDLTHFRYATFEELRCYCYRVASVVGLICLRIFGDEEERGRAYAENFV